jgi:hypothetical protein
MGVSASADIGPKDMEGMSNTSLGVRLSVTFCTPARSDMSALRLVEPVLFVHEQIFSVISDTLHPLERDDGVNDRQTTHVNPENSRHHCCLYTSHDEQYRQRHRYGCHPT